MRVAIIGRSSILYNCAQILLKNEYSIPLIITSKEAPEYNITSEDFKNLAKTIGAEFIYTPKINESAMIESIRNIGSIDIAVSINYSGVISKEVIDLFNLGILNAHGGDIPRYRGNACQAWAIINGEVKIGLCVHKMIGGELDNGSILSRSYLDININTKVGEVYDWMENETPSLMLNAIKQLEKNKNFVLEYQSKDPKKTLRCYPRNPSDGKIDWHKSNQEILRLINASSEPFSGAFCEYDNKKLIIWDAELFYDDEIYLAIPGQISELKKDGEMIVIAGNGKIKIKNIEMEGKRGKPLDFITSIRKRLK